MEELLNPPLGSSGPRKRYLAAAVLLVLITGGAFAMWKIRSVSPRNDSLIVVGKPLPHLIVRNQFKQPVDLGTIKPGTRRVVAFYSPQCGVCQQELPELIPFPAEIELIVVNEGKTAEEDPIAAGTGTAARLSDPDGIFRSAFKYPSLPTLLFVDERGVVVDGLIGAHPREVSQKKLHDFAQGRS